MPGFSNVYNRKAPIPGVSGRRIPGGSRMSPAQSVGGFRTNVPFLSRSQGGSAAFREYHRQQIRDVQGRFAGGWGFAWTGLHMLDDAIYGWAAQIEGDIKDAVERLAQEMLAYAKTNAPWSDRDPEERERAGDPAAGARESLQVSVVWQNDSHFTIFLGHGADIYYGIWLEVRWGGRYAILVPTMEQYAAKLGGLLASMT